MDSVGRSRFTGVVSDSTGNTRLHRELLTIEIPTLFNLPDIVHFINNTLKDIIQLPYFKKGNAIIRAVITKFHKAHLAISKFEAASKEVGITRGIESIGKTWFGTISDEQG